MQNIERIMSASGCPGWAGELPFVFEIIQIFADLYLPEGEKEGPKLPLSQGNISSGRCGRVFIRREKSLEKMIKFESWIGLTESKLQVV